MRIVATAARAVLGGYLAVHGAQKLFGSFGGPGLDAAAAGFEGMGLAPGKPMATLAAVSELGGGVLTATGIAAALGPLALAGAVTVATAVHRKAGPLSANGGYELPLTNLALAASVLAGPPGLRLGPRLSKKMSLAVLAGTAVSTGVTLARLLSPAPAPAPTPATAATAPVAAGATAATV